MKKISKLLSMMILSVFFIVPVVAYAATSVATVTFTPGSGAVTPRDPDDPTEDITPGGDGTVTGETGSLTLDYVSNIRFGSHTVESMEKIYKSETIKPYIQVSDRRGVNPAIGWRVEAKASAFTDGTNTTLAGSIITLNDGEALSGTDGTSGLDPEASIILNTDNTTESVLTAEATKGNGTWINRWYPTTDPDTATENNNVTLTVPANPTIGTHTSTITWTLIAAP